MDSKSTALFTQRDIRPVAALSLAGRPAIQATLGAVATRPTLRALAIVCFALTLPLSCTRAENTSAAGPGPLAANASLSAAASGLSPNSYADIVARVAPAVITIRSERHVRAPRQFPFGSDPFLQEFFGRGAIPQSPDNGGIQRGLGSGVIVKSNGYALTNHHVIDGAEEIRVEFSDGRIVRAKLVGSDPPSDLAVLKIDAADLPVLPLGNSDTVRVGDIALAVGNPLGVGQTVTMGIISAKGRTTGLSDGSFEDFLQTDAAINRGNSGGPLVNASGELIGINSQILSPSGVNIGIGFAIPSNMAQNVMDQLISTGKVRRSQLGIGIQRLTPELAAGLGLKDARGILVNGVTPGSPAELSGIRTGDVIVAIDGSAVDNGNTFRNRVASATPGTEVTLTINREGREQKLTAKLREFSPEAKPGEPVKSSALEPGSGSLGISVQPMTPSLAAQLRLPATTQGLLIGEVSPDSPAAEAGLAAGDVILTVNREPVRSAADIKASLQRRPSPALILINRSGQTLFFTINFKK